MTSSVSLFFAFVAGAVAHLSLVDGYLQNGAGISPHYSSGYRRVKRAADVRQSYRQPSDVASSQLGGGYYEDELPSRLFLSATATSSSTEVLERVKDVVAEQLGVERDKIQPESSFIGDLGADSLDSVELVMAFEEKLGVPIPDEEASKIKTVQDAANYITAHKATAGSS